MTNTILNRRLQMHRSLCAIWTRLRDFLVWRMVGVTLTVCVFYVKTIWGIVQAKTMTSVLDTATRSHRKFPVGFFFCRFYFIHKKKSLSTINQQPLHTFWYILCCTILSICISIRFDKIRVCCTESVNISMEFNNFIMIACQTIPAIFPFGIANVAHVCDTVRSRCGAYCKWILLSNSIWVDHFW